MRTLSSDLRDLRHCLGTQSGQDNDIHLHPFRSAAKVRDKTTAVVVPVRANQSALDQAGKDLA